MKKKPTVQETRETQLIYHEFIYNSIKFSFKCIDTKGTAKGWKLNGSISHHAHIAWIDVNIKLCINGAHKSHFSTIKTKTTIKLDLKTVKQP